MHMIRRDMAAQDLDPSLPAFLTDNLADALGNLAAEDFAPVLRDPHDVEVDRKNGMGAMAVITHAS
jgi:hypothetical protein